MVIAINRELEDALRQQAEEQGISPEDLAVSVLQSRFISKPGNDPRDDWELRLQALTVDCGVSLSDEAVSSEGIYD